MAMKFLNENDELLYGSDLETFSASLSAAAEKVLAERKSKRESLRAARQSHSSAERLAEELWSAAIDKDGSRAKILFSSGAKPTHREMAGWDFRKGRQMGDLVEIGPMERSALAGNVGFLREALAAGLDPFENLEGWLEVCGPDSPWRFGVNGRGDEQSRWLLSAFQAGGSMHAVEVAREWVLHAGKARCASTGCQEALEAASWLGSQPHVNHGQFMALLDCLMEWESWASGKNHELGQRDALKLSRDLSKAPDFGQEMSLVAWSRVAQRRGGALCALALSGQSSPGPLLDWPQGQGLSPRVRSICRGGSAGWLALANDALELATVLFKASSPCPMSDASLDQAAVAWACSRSFGAARKIRDLGWSLVELDRRAMEIGALGKPKLVVLSVDERRFDQAISMSKLDLDLWDYAPPSGQQAKLQLTSESCRLRSEEAGGYVEGPQILAMIEKIMLGGASEKSKQSQLAKRL